MNSKFQVWESQRITEKSYLTSEFIDPAGASSFTSKVADKCTIFALLTTMVIDNRVCSSNLGEEYDSRSQRRLARVLGEKRNSRISSLVLQCTISRCVYSSTGARHEGELLFGTNIYSRTHVWDEYMRSLCIRHIVCTSVIVDAMTHVSSCLMIGRARARAHTQAARHHNSGTALRIHSAAQGRKGICLQSVCIEARIGRTGTVTRAAS